MTTPAWKQPDSLLGANSQNSRGGKAGLFEAAAACEEDPEEEHLFPRERQRQQLLRKADQYDQRYEVIASAETKEKDQHQALAAGSIQAQQQSASTQEAFESCPGVRPEQTQVTNAIQEKNDVGESSILGAN